MRKSDESEEFKKKYGNLVPLIERIESTGLNGFSEEVLNSVKSFIKPLLIAHLEAGASAHIIKKWKDVWNTQEVYNSFKEEIHYALSQQRDQVDVFYKHKLLMKKVSEMTGYEYRTFLRIIGPAPKEPTSQD